MNFNFDEFQNIWTNIGFNQVEIEKRKSAISDYWKKMRLEMLKEEKQLEVDLKQEIHKIQNDIKTMRACLEMPPNDAIPSQQKLLQQKEALLASKLAITAEFDAQRVEFDCEFERMQSIVAQLGIHSEFSRPSNQPTKSQLVKLKQYGVRLRQIQTEKAAQLRQLTDAITSTMAHLDRDEIEPLMGPHCSVVQSALKIEAAALQQREEEGVDLSDDAIQRFREAHEILAREYNTQKSACEKIRRVVAVLRGRMGDAAQQVADAFAPDERVLAQYSATTKSKLNGELSALRGIRVAQRETFYREKWCALEELLQECNANDYILEQHRLEKSPLEISEQSLDMLDVKLEFWREFQAVHAAVYAAFKVWRDNLRTYESVETKRKDPNVVRNNRGGILLRLENESKAAMKAVRSSVRTIAEALERCDTQAHEPARSNMLAVYLDSGGSSAATTATTTPPQIASSSPEMEGELEEEEEEATTTKPQTLCAKSAQFDDFVAIGGTSMRRFIFARNEEHKIDSLALGLQQFGREASACAAATPTVRGAAIPAKRNEATHSDSLCMNSKNIKLDPCLESTRRH